MSQHIHDTYRIGLGIWVNGKRYQGRFREGSLNRFILRKNFKKFLKIRGWASHRRLCPSFIGGNCVAALRKHQRERDGQQA